MHCLWPVGLFGFLWPWSAQCFCWLVCVCVVTYFVKKGPVSGPLRCLRARSLSLFMSPIVRLMVNTLPPHCEIQVKHKMLNIWCCAFPLYQSRCPMMSASPMTVVLMDGRAQCRQNSHQEGTSPLVINTWACERYSEAVRPWCTQQLYIRASHLTRAATTAHKDFLIPSFPIWSPLSLRFCLVLLLS